MPFIAGQRWVSHAEPELGLGIVAEYDTRRVVIEYPAVNERRIYAQEAAPLTRIAYKPGDTIQNNNAVTFVVLKVEEHSGLLFYRSRDRRGDEYILAESDLNAFIQLNRPEQRLYNRQFDASSKFALRVETLRRWNLLEQSSVRGLLGARMQLLPHQIYVAAEIARRHAPRVLLADEVGLGKTIEAGLIIHCQLQTGAAERVIIVVPDHLLHQWLVEMLRRFNLHFALFDAGRYQAMLESGEQNPFECEQKVLCGLNELSENPGMREMAYRAEWNLVVVDEAHHLQGAAFRCVAALAARGSGLLLLTATPEQAGEAAHFARLRLLDPARFHSLSAYQQEACAYHELNHLFERLLNGESLHGALGTELNRFLGDANEYVHLPREEIVRRLLDRHGTGRVVFRNTRAVVKGFPSRRVMTYPLNNPEIYTLYKAEILPQDLYPELRIGDARWLQQDPRVAWLSTFLQQYNPEKVLVICASVQTAKMLERYLHLRIGIRSAAFHQEMSIIDRDRAAAYFAEHEQGAQCLICSEIGSEGRNFQFSRHLVLFDLPLNPDLLEQRIGRLDRIGQQNEINIHIPYLLNSPQEILYRWYHQGLNAFAQSCAIGYRIYQQFAERLHAQLLHGDAGLDGLTEETAIAAQQLVEEMARGRDRLLELNSCDGVRAQALIADIQAMENGVELQNYMAKMFDAFGVEHEYHSQHAEILLPTARMQDLHFPGLKEDGVSIVYDRKRALQREDMAFLSWEHPMVSDAMNMLLESGRGSVALTVLKGKKLTPGIIALEMFYTFSTMAPKALQLARYLPSPLIRFVLDNNGNDHAAYISLDEISMHCEDVAKSIVPAVMDKINSQVEAIAEQGKQLAEQALAVWKQQAQTEIQAALSKELARLQALHAVNASIRDDEVTSLQDKLRDSQAAIAQSVVQLQALRILIAV